MKPLNPIMAVLVIATVGALPLRAFAVDGDKAADAATSDDKNPVNALAKIFKDNADARKDAGKRFEDFLLKPEAGKSFVATDVVQAALGAQAREWGESKGAVGDVAVLYFVTGPGLAAPGWALKDPVLSKTFKPGMQWEGRLRAALADWSGKSQIDKSKEATQVTAFLNDAAKKAAEIFSDPRTKKEIDLSVAGNDDTGAVFPGMRRNGGSRLGGPARQYTLDDLYLNGAEVKDVSGPKDEGSRKISMKIYTRHLDDGSLVNEIGIFDITDTNDIVGQYFPISQLSKKDFKLDDRPTGDKDVVRMSYNLKFGDADKDGNRSITFERPDGKHSLTTSVSDLFKKRADQAEALGDIVTIGGKDFYSLPEGGGVSGLSLFPKALIDGRRDVDPATGKPRDPRDLVPAVYSEVGSRGPDGRNQNAPAGEKGGPQLGKIGDKEYHLEWNSKLVPPAWEVKEGAGNAPVRPKAKDADEPMADVAASPNGLSVADLKRLLPDCKDNPADTEQIAPGLKGKYDVVYCSNKIDGRYPIIFVPKSSDSPDQQLRYPDLPIARVRFVGHHMVFEMKTQKLYLDLLKKKKGNYESAGFVDSANQITAKEFTDPTMFVDALKNYMAIPAGSKDQDALTEVPKRGKEALGDKPYSLTGSFAGSDLIVTATSEGVPYPLWPKVIKPGAADPAAGQYTKLSGPANAMDGSVSSVDAPIPDAIDLKENRKGKLYGNRKQNDIAMYEDVSAGPGNEKYYVMFRFKAFDSLTKKDAIFLQSQFEVFNSSNPLPASFEMQGLTEGVSITSRTAAGYRFIAGSSKEKGVLAVFQNKQIGGQQKETEANCVGPIVWWGLKDRDAAMTVCKNDKF